MHHFRLNQVRKTILTTIINLFLYCLAFAQDGDKIPFSKIGPLSLDSSTSWVQQIFDTAIKKEVQLVGLGEMCHGAYEPLVLKAKMVQYLVENRGYRNLLMEFPDIMPICEVRRYLLNNDINELSIADSLAKITANGLLNAAEVLGQLYRWLKTYNLAHPGEMVKVFGFDLSQDAGYRNFFLYNYIVPLDPEYAERLIYYWSNNGLNDSLKIASISTWFNNNKEKLTKDEFTEITYHLQSEMHAIHLEALKARPSGFDYFVSHYRDSVMANNVISLIDGQKAIIWAHNGHVFTGDGSMGKHLKERYQSRYFTLLTDFSNEANVYAKSATDGLMHEQQFVSGRSTIARNLFKNYGIPEGIIFDKYIPTRKVYDGINTIDYIGRHFVQTPGPFDVLVMFNNVNPYLKPAK